MGAVYAGWLTKSPEDRKGLLSIFAARQQWRRRYFVLYTAPTTSASSEVTWTNPPSVLIYYEDEAMTVRKGMIDLGNCEEIIDHVESCYYQHLFLLKTATQRGHRRTYYLAADAADDVTNWVKKLHSTLNLYEDKLFTNAVLSVTNPASNVTGIIARITSLEASSVNSKTNKKKTPFGATLMLGTPRTGATNTIPYVRTPVLHSETPARGLDLLPNKAKLCDSNAAASVTKCEKKLAPPKIPAKPTTSAETGSSRSLNSASSATRSSPSCVTSSLPRDLQNEASSSGNACVGQNGAEYYEELQQFVKDLVDDGGSPRSDRTIERDEGRGTEEEEEDERNEGQERKAEGRSVFYIYTSPYSLDTKAEAKAAHKSRRTNSPKRNDEAPAHPSAQPSSDATCYLRITRGSHRYRSVKKKHRT